MTPRTLEWLQEYLDEYVWSSVDDVIEVGSLNVNGSARSIVQPLIGKHGSYLGIDVVAGPGVDMVTRLEDFYAERYVRAYDMVICTEVLEHVEDWRTFLTMLCNMSRAYVVLTTRAPGFPKHDYPADYHRFRLGALVDKVTSHRFDICDARDDEEDLGVYLIARRRTIE